MKAQEFLNEISACGIDVIAGVPDSTLKSFCDALQFEKEHFRHYVTANEGAAVGVAMGSYLASGKPACVYMQNSGIGNIVNPVTSLANADVYGIPMLFIVGWRGEPGVKDEPQHVFQGKITLKMFETLAIPYAVIDSQTTVTDIRDILKRAQDAFARSEQFAVVVKKGTFEKDKAFSWENGYPMKREEFLGKLLEVLPPRAAVVSTTGKISRELYEQSNRLFGGHERIFMTVGGMGHASMIAYGIAQEKPDTKVVCIDGDGAALMHMGAMSFIASRKPANYYHIVVNNHAHESVGAMPTDCAPVSFAKVAKSVGYRYADVIESKEQIEKIGKAVNEMQGPCLFEAMVALDSRADLSRPAETARENREAFAAYLKTL